MNVIVIKTDQHVFNAVGCMGNPVVATPNLDRLAQRSAVFENCFTVSTLCVPSRVSFFTGQYVHRTGATDNSRKSHIQDRQWCFVDVFKEQGYDIGLAGKNHAFADSYLSSRFSFREEYGHFGKTNGTITDGDRAVSEFRSKDPRPGFERDMMLGGYMPIPEPFPPEQCMTARIAEDAITFIKQPRQTDFFLHLSFPDPHWPQVVCEPYASMYDASTIALPPGSENLDAHPFAHFVQSNVLGFPELSDEDLKRTIATYCGQITFIDACIGDVLDVLEDEELMEHTVVVFDSDHGDFCGQFGVVEKTKGFYENLIHVPLLISLPGLTHGQRISADVSTIDVMPTVAEFLDLEIPEPVQGKSFLDLMYGKTDTHREAVFCEVGEPTLPPAPVSREPFADLNEKRSEEDGRFWFIEYTTRGRSAMIRKGGWKYCYYSGDLEELYHTEDDRWELQNLASQQEHSQKKEELKNTLLEWLLVSTVL